MIVTKGFRSPVAPFTTNGSDVIVMDGTPLTAPELGNYVHAMASGFGAQGLTGHWGWVDGATATWAVDKGSMLVEVSCAPLVLWGTMTGSPSWLVREATAIVHESAKQCVTADDWSTYGRVICAVAPGETVKLTHAFDSDARFYGVTTFHKFYLAGTLSGLTSKNVSSGIGKIAGHVVTVR